jgi:hypothetical protein
MVDSTGKRVSIKVAPWVNEKLKDRRDEMRKASGVEPTLTQLLEQAVEQFVGRPAEELESPPTAKEKSLNDQFVSFVRSAPKADVQLVLSLMARFSEDRTKHNQSFEERRRGGR